MLPLMTHSSPLKPLPLFALPFIPHLEPLMKESQPSSVPAGILPVTATVRTASQLCLRSKPSQVKVWVVLDRSIDKQKQGWPWSSWGESSTSQPRRGIQDKGFTSWKYVGVSESDRKQVDYAKVKAVHKDFVGKKKLSHSGAATEKCDLLFIRGYTT